MLTDKEIKSAPVKEKAYALSDGNGLLLSVTPKGTKSWVVRVYTRGKEHRRGIGSYPDVSLKKAREICAKLKSGGLGERENLRFSELYNEWLEGIAKTHSVSYLRNLGYRADKYILPALGDYKVGMITPRLILNLCREIENLGYYEVAKRTRITIHQVMEHAIDMGDIEHNPADRVGRSMVHHQEKHLATTVGAENIGALLATIENYQGSIIVRSCLKLLAYTFVRPSEARNACWSEFDFENEIWTIPAARMKMSREHKVPLSSQAINLLANLRELTGHTKYLFPSPRSNKATINIDSLRQALRRMNIGKDDMTPHGFRAMASTILNENNFPSDAIEVQLSHIDKDRVRSAYNRAEYLEIRKKMLQWYADYLDACRLKNAEN